MQKNNPNNEMLDSRIKESLEGYEVPYNPSHWDEMEKMLDAAPKNYASFKSFKGWNWGLNALVGLSLLAGGYLIYAFTGTSSAKPEMKEEVVAAPSKPGAPAPTLTKQAPAVMQNTSVPEVASAAEAAEQTTMTSAPASMTMPGSVSMTGTYQKKNMKKESAPAQAEGVAKSDAPDDFDFSKLQMDLGRSLNNVPTFGDQIDKREGFIKSTSEDQSYIKEAKEKITNGVTDNFVPTQLKKDSADKTGSAEIKPEGGGSPVDSDSPKKRRKSRKKDEIQ